jgi:hypothetical protein
MVRTPDKARKAAERERRQRQGLVRVEVYVRPADRGKVRKYAERLNKRASLQEGEGL